MNVFDSLKEILKNKGEDGVNEEMSLRDLLDLIDIKSRAPALWDDSQAGRP